ncbi:MAG: hypothetical protein ABIP06_06095 [Pyrinomonadaceae bacterium]
MTDPNIDATESDSPQAETDTSTDNQSEGQAKPKTEADTSTDTPEGDKNEGDKGKSFTQSELDTIVQKRLATEKKRWEKDKDLPELEKLRTQNEEITKKLRERDVTDSFTATAMSAGAKNIDRLLKIYRADLIVAEDGSIENLTDILATARNDFPEFFSKGSADAGAGKSETKLTLDQQVEAEYQKSGRQNAFRL